MSYFKHANALVETEQVGDGTRVWAFAHILPGAVIGRDCIIYPGANIRGVVPRAHIVKLRQDLQTMSRRDLR